MNILSDTLDFEILKRLQVDGRISFTDLAKELDVSVSTIRTRYNNLVQDKSITVYGRINPEKIGLTSYARILLSIRPKTKIGGVIETLIGMPEISFLASVSGEYDIEINTMCQDNNHLLELLHEKINQIDGVYNTLTNFYLKIHKFSPPDLDYIKNYIDNKND